MSVVASELISPEGDVLPEMFPRKQGQDDAAALAALEERVNKYIIRGEAWVAAKGIVDPDDADAATANYAYYLAFEDVYVRLASQPASLTFADAGGRTRTQAQIDAFHNKALAYLGAATDLVPPDSTTTFDTTERSTSRKNNYTW
jgi:hypothetical protein